jgi:hypothetical protein
VIPVSEVQHNSRIEQCPACQAEPGSTGTMVMWVDGDTVVEQWHTEDCPDHGARMAHVEEAAAEQARQQEWVDAAFPAAYARLQQALNALPASERAHPFTAALAELAALQAERQAGHGGLVTLPEWTQILERHFPPQP